MSLKVKDLRIGLGTSKIVIQDVSFNLSKGQMHAIVGSSGAGKSTICKAIMGILGEEYCVEGSIKYQGIELLDVSNAKKQHIFGKEICFIMQNPMTAFNPSLLIGKQMEKTYLKHHSKTSKAEVRKKCEVVLEKLALPDIPRILKSYPFMLSGGMLQRIMIATALMNEPKILIADEATTAIDACNRVELMKLLKSLCEEGMSILFVTHDLRSAIYSDTMMIMNEGNILETGKTAQLFACPKEAYTKTLLSACTLERRESG